MTLRFRGVIFYTQKMEGNRMKAGELFAGYGGLALATELVFNAETAWVCEWEEAPSKVLSHRFPGVPNHKDVSTVDWVQVEPVNIISGGSPCQDLSAAGAKRGMVEGTRSNLWVSMREAISVIRPELVVWENVRGAFSARAFSEMERTVGCMGAGNGGATEPVLRALGRLLGDLSSLGYDAQWRVVRASDIGAPHRRERVFVLGHRRDSYTYDERRLTGRFESSQENAVDVEYADVGERFGGGGEVFNDKKLMPTPNTFDSLDWREGEARLRALMRGDGRRHPSARTGNLREEIHYNFREFEPAIRHWERVCGRSAPPAAVPSRSGRPQLNPRFSEWLMGLPDGWVTDPVLGLSRVEVLRMLGNGVVPWQAVFALSGLWGNLVRV